MSKKLILYLPLFMRKSKVYNEIFNTVENQFQYVKSNIKDVRKQLDIDTATWGLDVYEKDLGITTNLSKPLSERRALIKSKERGTGKVDSLLIKIVADAYTNGDVDVSFDGKINIKFNSVLGIPPNLADLENSLEEIKPAHLDIVYTFAYLLIKNIHNVMTINELQQTPLNKFAGGGN